MLIRAALRLTQELELCKICLDSKELQSCSLLISLTTSQECKTSPTKPKPQKHVHRNQINRNAAALTDLKENNQLRASLFNLPNVRRLQTIPLFTLWLFFPPFWQQQKQITLNSSLFNLQPEQHRRHERQQHRAEKRHLAPAPLAKTTAKLFHACCAQEELLQLQCPTTHTDDAFAFIKHLNHFFSQSGFPARCGSCLQTPAPVIPSSTRLKITLYLARSLWTYLNSTIRLLSNLPFDKLIRLISRSLSPPGTFFKPRNMTCIFRQSKQHPQGQVILQVSKTRWRPPGPLTNTFASLTLMGVLAQSPETITLWGQTDESVNLSSSLLKLQNLFDSYKKKKR